MKIPEGDESIDRMAAAFERIEEACQQIARNLLYIQREIKLTKDDIMIIKEQKQ